MTTTRRIVLAHNTMDVNGLHCGVNLPDAPEGDGVHGLPPHKPRQVYKVDEFPACPTTWMHGSDKASSYFFPVGKGKHLWLDFNQNARHTHHIAIVMSVQGINPVTNEQTKALNLQQFRDKCPKHPNEAFQQDRFCEKCGFKWPSQNYMTTVSTPRGQLWADGWRIEDGTIRGFLITAETMKGIATQLIGEQRVWAIGIAFYLSKEAKPKPASPLRSRTVQCSTFGGGDGKLYSGGNTKGTPASFNFVDNESLTSSLDSGDHEVVNSFLDLADKGSVQSRGISGQSVQPIETEKLEIAAGAKITQELAYHDPNNLDFYEDEPAGVIYANYCTEGDFETIVAAGAKDMTKGGEGSLAGLNTGNPAQISK